MGNGPSCQNPKAKLSRGFGIRGFSWWKLLPGCGLGWPCNVMLMCEGVGAGKSAQGKAGEGRERAPHNSPTFPSTRLKELRGQLEKVAKGKQVSPSAPHTAGTYRRMYIPKLGHLTPTPPQSPTRPNQCRQSSNQSGPTGGNAIRRMNSHMETARRREGKDPP